MPTDCVDIKAYDVQNTLIFHQIYSIENWYEEMHPIIDYNRFRVRYKVATIEGIRYDAQGSQQRWIATYAEDGSLIEALDKD